jgi:hypothetical protein
MKDGKRIILICVFLILIWALSLTTFFNHINNSSLPMNYKSHFAALIYVHMLYWKECALSKLKK